MERFSQWLKAGNIVLIIFASLVFLVFLSGGTFGAAFATAIIVLIWFAYILTQAH